MLWRRNFVNSMSPPNTATFDNPVVEIARINKIDIREYFNEPKLFIDFVYESSGQSLIHEVSVEFVKKFMQVFNATELSKCVGEVCWVTHTHYTVLSIHNLTFEGRKAERYDVVSTRTEELDD